jgi:predicted transcriptional regulator YdeE
MDQPEIIHRDAMNVIGIEVRTSNKDEADRDRAKIPLLWQRFFQENIREKIPNKVQPEHLLAIYTDYESDEHGLYTEILGYQVSSIQDISQGMVAKAIPESDYALFTTPAGPVTTTIGQAWKEIWLVQPAQLGGSRRFSADFELYDERSSDPENTIVDIYIAILRR